MGFDLYTIPKGQGQVRMPALGGAGHSTLLHRPYCSLIVAKNLRNFMRMTAKEIIQRLNLLPHPEGGFYKEVYRAQGTIGAACLPSLFGGERNYSTSIYYLLQQGDYSAFHRIKSDELWHFYAGGPLLVHCLSEEKGYTCLRLGNNLAAGESFQFVVPAGVWFASEPAQGTAFALAGCTVSPGFDFRDFEMADKDDLLQQFPQFHEYINRLCR